MVWGRLGLPAPPPITPCLCPPRVLTYGTGSWRGYRGTQRGHGGGLQGGLGVPEHPPQVSPGAGQGHREAMGGHAGAAGGTKKGLRDASAPPSLHVPPGVPKGGLGTWRGCRGMRGGGHTEGTWGVLGVLVPPIAPCVCPPASLGVPKSGVGTWRGCRGTRGGLGGLASTLPVTPICGVPPPVSPTAAWGHGEATGRVRGGLQGDTGGCHCHPVCFCVPPGVPSQQAPGRMGDPRPAGSEAGAGAAERSQDPHQERAARLPARFPGARSGEGTAWGQLGGDDGDTSPGERGVGCCRARGGHVGTGGGLGGCARERGQAWGDTRESIVTGDSPGGTP